MIHIGIMGGIGHGKTTFAKTLQAVEPNSIFLESSALIAEVVNTWRRDTVIMIPPTFDFEASDWIAHLRWPLEQSLQIEIEPGQLAFTDDDVKNNPALYRKLFEYLGEVRANQRVLLPTITASNKEEYRGILQWVGGYVQEKLAAGAWFLELARRAQQAEARGCKVALYGGVRYPADANVIRENKGFIVNMFRPSMAPFDVDDPTEKARGHITADTTVVNDGTFADLSTTARILLRDAELGHVRQKYIASNKDSQSATIRRIKK